MKAKIKKVVAWGCGLPVAFLILGMVLLLYETHKKLEYRETSFEKDYSWNDVNVGVVIRYPINTSVPIGRYCAIIALKDDLARARILFRGPLGEVPVRPEFVSGKEQTVIYRTSKGELSFDLSRWLAYPGRDSMIPDSDHPAEAHAVSPSQHRKREIDESGSSTNSAQQSIFLISRSDVSALRHGNAEEKARNIAIALKQAAGPES